MDNDTLEKLLTIYEENKRKAAKTPTILSVLGRTYDEDLISRLVLKCLEDDPSSLAALMKEYDDSNRRSGVEKSGIVIDEGKCEKVGEGLTRIDIFLRGHNSHGESFLVIIENKVRSWEHSDQTKAYERWAKQQATDDDTLYFIYLKPSWNGSTPSSKGFAVVDYNSFAKMFQHRNKFIDELIDHIENHLEAKTMLDPFVVDHFKEITEIAHELEQKRIQAAMSINEAIHQTFSGTKLTENHSPTRGIFRYYACDLGWWNPTFMYYFFIEFKIAEDGDLNHICVQRTLKTYPKSNASILEEFIKRMNFTLEHKATCESRRFWVYRWDIHPEGVPLSEEWCESMKAMILEKMKIAFEEQKAIVEAFMQQHSISD